MEDGEPYLDGLRVYVACAAPSEFMELVSICREGGACRYPRLDPLITHLVVRCCIMCWRLVFLLTCGISWQSCTFAPSALILQQAHALWNGRPLMGF